MCQDRVGYRSRGRQECAATRLIRFCAGLLERVRCLWMSQISRCRCRCRFRLSHYDCDTDTDTDTEDRGQACKNGDHDSSVLGEASLLVLLVLFLFLALLRVVASRLDRSIWISEARLFCHAVVLAHDLFHIHRGRGEGHLQRLKRLRDDLRDRQVSEPLVVGRDDEPGRLLGAAFARAHPRTRWCRHPKTGVRHSHPR